MKKSINKTILTSLALLFFACSDNANMGHIKNINFEKEYISKGKYIYETAGCDSCHSSITNKTSKTKSLDTKGILAPNLNNSKKSIGDWNVSELVHFFRTGITKDKFKIIAGVHEGYEWMSDKDSLALASYLKVLPVTKAKPFSRKTEFSSFSFNVLNDRKVSGFIPEILSTNQVSYGKYLVDHIARCSECHMAEEGMFIDEIFLGGGRRFYVESEDVDVPSLNGGESAFIKWNSFQMTKFLKSGEKPNGLKVDKEYCPTDSFSKFNSQDTLSIVKYFTSFNQE